jgi:hypothetical protein
LIRFFESPCPFPLVVTEKGQGASMKAMATIGRAATMTAIFGEALKENAGEIWRTPL